MRCMKKAAPRDIRRFESEGIKISVWVTEKLQVNWRELFKRPSTNPLLTMGTDFTSKEK